jgi:hypothetical protein
LASAAAEAGRLLGHQPFAEPRFVGAGFVHGE